MTHARTLALANASVIRNKRAILDQVTLDLAPGKFTALCGANGAGKTTALSVLSGALKPDRGQALLDERSIYAYRSEQLARRRAVVAQNSQLTFPFEVHEVVTMGRVPHYGRSTVQHDREIVAAVIDLMQLRPLAERIFTTLSGGERQRVHIARALAQVWEPADEDTARWLLLDEPTSALDLKYKIQLMQLLQSLAAQGWGITAVLHDLHLVRTYADDIVLFKDGQIVAAGPVEETLSGPLIQDVFDLTEPYVLD